jgi:hypothetical protein
MTMVSPASFFGRVSFWPRFRRALLMFFVPIMVAAVIPALAIIIHDFSDISFSTHKLIKEVPAPLQPTPAAPHVEQPQSTPDMMTIPATGIVKAWDAARTSKDIAKLFNFAKEYPGTPYETEAWLHMNKLVESGGLTLASFGDDADFIGEALGHKEQAPAILNKIADDHDLERKYPFGYAIFYSDGNKTVHSGVSNQNGNVRFDPASLDMTFRDNKSICVKTISVALDGRFMAKIIGMCFGGNGSAPLHLVNIQHSIELDAEALGQSQHGLAWAIGLRGL